VERDLAERFGILSLASVETEVELGNDECSGHTLNIWHTANLVHIPLLPVVGDVVVVLGVLGEATSDVVSRGSWIRLRNSGREGHLLVGCPSLS
jgi:hypothetical protein